MDYYNEFDPEAAAWLEELIAQGHLPPGVVDTRSIVDVHPDDLRPFQWCHFFAGIGVWPYALARVGWPRDRRTWTGSPPCQPFSAAGKGLGVADERHLWPAYFHLIDICRPDDVLGEQVASKDGLAWLDIVRPDMEGAAYSFGVFDLCSAGVGSPNRRQRLYFYGTRGMADAKGHRQRTGLRDFGSPELGWNQPSDSGSLGGLDHPGSPRLEGYGGDGDGAAGRSLPTGSVTQTGEPRWLADTDDAERRSDLSRRDDVIRANAGRTEGSGDPGTGRSDGGMADADGGRREVALQHAGSGRETSSQREADAFGGNRASCGPSGLEDSPSAGFAGEHRLSEDLQTQGGGLFSAGSSRPFSDRSGWTGPTNGFWADADWLGCRDGKWRPVEPGTSPLATGSSARMGLLRGYGNACNAELATEFAAAIRDAEAAGFAPLGDLIELQAIEVEVEDDLADLLS